MVWEARNLYLIHLYATHYSQGILGMETQHITRSVLVSFETVSRLQNTMTPSRTRIGTASCII